MSHKAAMSHKAMSLKGIFIPIPTPFQNPIPSPIPIVFFLRYRSRIRRSIIGYRGQGRHPLFTVLVYL